MTLDLAALEMAALRAWPAAEERRMGEWLLRLDAGYTKRTNAVYVLGPERDANLIERIAAFDAIYQERGLPLIIRESSLAPDPALADQMIGRGFTRFDETIVMATDSLPAGPTLPDQTDLAHWLALYAQFEGATKGDQRHHHEIISRIALPICLGIRHAEGTPVAIGLAVTDGPWVGLFDIATDPERRRQGHGRRLVAELLGWGRRAGAARAYLQVLTTNAPAIALYEQLGFREAYRYWYWMDTRT